MIDKCKLICRSFLYGNRVCSIVWKWGQLSKVEIYIVFNENGIVVKKGFLQVMRIFDNVECYFL